MLAIMRDTNVPIDLRCEAAVAAAPYVHQVPPPIVLPPLQRLVG
jgi:hypothetical protein